MATVVLLFGGECTGKTALAEELAASITTTQVIVVPEVLRAFTAHNQRAPRQSEQMGIWQAQTRLLDEAIADSPADGLVICDPAPLMTAVYSLQYFDDDSLLQPAVSATDPGHLVVLCAPDMPWAPDGAQRDGPRARERTQLLLHTQIVPALHRSTVISADGELSERVAQLKIRLP